MKQSDIVAIAVRGALYALRDPEPAATPADMNLTLDEFRAMYQAQCTATDEWAARAEVAEKARRPSELEKRVKELEGQLAAVNRRLGNANTSAELATYQAAKAAKAELDDCTHPDCLQDREVNGYSSCAGGHLARSVVKAILGTDKIKEPAGV